MSEIDKYDVKQMHDREIIKEWIENKHYAKRMPTVKYGFGLFENNILVGICTFAHPPNYRFNNGDCIFNNYNVMTLELNRLVTDDGLYKNALSYFIMKCIRMLPKPMCLVSYADPNYGHYGYIYQATNWIYTGDSSPKIRYHFKDGTSFDIRRHIDKKIEEHGKVIKKEKMKPTQRYIYFHGNKNHIRQMKQHFKMKDLPYPKGDNYRHDINYKCKKITIEDCT